MATRGTAGKQSFARVHNAKYKVNAILCQMLEGSSAAAPPLLVDYWPLLLLLTLSLRFLRPSSELFCASARAFSILVPIPSN